MSHGYGYNRPRVDYGYSFLGIKITADLKTVTKKLQDYELAVAKYNRELAKLKAKFPNDPAKVSQKINAELKKVDKTREAMQAEARKLQTRGKLPVELAERIFGSSGTVAPPLSQPTAPPVIPPEPTAEELIVASQGETYQEPSKAPLFIAAGVLGLGLVGFFLWRRSR